MARKNRKKRYHLMRSEKGKGISKVTTKHSYGSLKTKLSDNHFMMESRFKEDCREDEKPGWQKTKDLNDSKLFKIADKGLLSTKKRKCKKEVKTKK